MRLRIRPIRFTATLVNGSVVALEESVTGKEILVTIVQAIVVTMVARFPFLQFAGNKRLKVKAAKIHRLPLLLLSADKDTASKVSLLLDTNIFPLGLVVHMSGFSVDVVLVSVIVLIIRIKIPFFLGIVSRVCIRLNDRNRHLSGHD